jgi:hypothetical protein
VPGEELLERGDGLGFVFENGEEVEQADHFEGLDRKFGWLEEADGTARLFRAGEMPNEHADAAGIDGRDAFEIQDDFGMGVTQEFVHGGIKAIERGTHAQATRDRNHFDGILRFDVDIQRGNPLAAEVTSGEPH